MLEDEVLRVRDRERWLLLKVNRGRNRLYVTKLQVTQPVCLAARLGDDTWLWHGRFGHISFDALARLGRHNMVRGLPTIEHVEELCDSCLAGKQRRQSFPCKATYRAESLLDLVHATCVDQSPRRRMGVGATSFYWWMTAVSTCGYDCSPPKTRLPEPS